MRTLPAAALAGFLSLPHAVHSGVVINEIFYNAPSDLDELQWIELHNTGTEPVDLGGWRLSKGVQYAFPMGARMEAGGFLVLCRDANLFRENYGMAAAGTFASRLSTKGERVELVDAAGGVKDSVRYGSRAPWPTGPDGYSGSLERISASSPGDDASNWISSPLSESREKPMGTPGQPNAGRMPAVPPVFLGVDFPTAFPSPDQPVTVEARLNVGGGVSAVGLFYRVASPGTEGAETMVAMREIGPGRYAGTIPGQSAERLIRFRVEATGASGVRRSFPAATEPRPALSAFVLATNSEAAVSRVWILHTTEPEMRSAADRANQPMFGGFMPPPDPDAEARTRMRRMAGDEADLSGLWFRIGLAAKGDPAGLERARAWMLGLVGERMALLSGAMEGAGSVADRLPKWGEQLRAFESKAIASALDQVPAAARPAIEGWQAARAGRDASGGRMILGRVDLEGAWHAVSLNSRWDAAQVPALLEELGLIDMEREALVAEVLAGKGADSGFRDQRDRAEELGGNIARRLRAHLSGEQGQALDAWVRGPREAIIGIRSPEVRAGNAAGGTGPRPGPGGGPPGFRFGFGGPPRGGPGGPFGGPPSEPGTHRSAIVYWEAGARSPQLFDFVQLTGRKGGRKVHVPKEHPVVGMTTFALIFEGETAALVEPLAFEVYRRAGMAVGKSGVVRLWEDGKAQGYSVLVEQPNRGFLRRQGINAEGTMYKLLWYGGDLQGQHEKHSRRREDHADLVALVDGLEKSTGERQWAFIREHFDVDQVAIYFAVNMILSHWDGFFNNYFAYHDSAGTGKWMMFPWDQDSTWGTRAMGGGPNGVFYTMPLTFGMIGDEPPPGAGWWRQPGWFSGPLLANPQFRRVYLATIRRILEKVYSEAAFGPVMDEYERQLIPEVRLAAEQQRQDPAAAEQRLRLDLARCREHLRKRREFLLAQEELQTLPRP